MRLAQVRPIVRSCLHDKVAEDDETEGGVYALQEALSDAVKKRQDLHHEFFLEKESRERAERECIELGLLMKNWESYSGWRVRMALLQP